jgi:hypothetical protein
VAARRASGAGLAALVIGVVLAALLVLGWMAYAGRTPGPVRVAVAAAPEGLPPDLPTPSLPPAPMPSGRTS